MDLIATAPRATPRSRPLAISRTVLAAALLAVLAACGGGGGGGAPQASSQGSSGGQDSAAGSGGSGTSASSGSTSGTTTGGSAWSPATIAPLAAGTSVFRFEPVASMADAASLQQAVGGPLFTAWDPADPSTALAAGMKVEFFGLPDGCSRPQDQGPTTSESDATAATALSRMAVGATTAAAIRWAPSSDTAVCDAAHQGLSGPSLVEMQASDTHGQVGMYTATAADGSGFLRPWGASGQNGAGANAGITGSFVAFRQAWWSTAAIQPFAVAGGQSAARIVSTQTVRSESVDSSTGTAGMNQVKQQISATFLNVECMKAGASGAHPCQVQYLFNTAIYRTGVTDWSTQAWFSNGSVWFDPAQGGIPVIDGPIGAAGVSTLDQDSGLSLFTSQGGATHHDLFAGENFDLRVSFDQLQNVMRIFVARQAGVAVGAVTNDQLAATWGARWNDPTAWVLLSADVGQEVYNPYADRDAWLGGGFSRLYVAPAGA